MTTLSTGSIVLLTTLLEKIFKNPVWKSLIITSVIFFMISTVSAVVFQSASVISANYFRNAPLGNKTRATLAISISLMWVSFLLGVVFLTFFAVLNFERPNSPEIQCISAELVCKGTMVNN